MALNNGWIKIENASGSGDTAVSVEILAKNTGRSVTRSATVVGTTTQGAEATAIITQGPAPLFIIIDHFEDGNGTTVDHLAGAAADYKIVGFANVDRLTAEETSDKEYTDLNTQQGLAQTNGFSVIDSEGGLYNETLGTAYSHGEDAQYTFKIPFRSYGNEGSSARNVSFLVTNGALVQNTATIQQAGTIV